MLKRVPRKTDFLLIGGGIMSASLGTAAGAAAGLGSDHGGETGRRGAGVFNGWNNAGTGHSANMELNYTPERADGSIDVSKALDINEQFMISVSSGRHR